MFVVAFTTESGYILGLGAISADGMRWIRWFCPGTVNCKDYPRVKAYSTRKEARSHASYVLAHAKKSGVLSHSAKSEVLHVWE